MSYVNGNSPLARTQEIELNGTYAGWKFTARLNPPMRVIKDLTGRDMAKMLPALADVILAWEGFTDDKGKALGPPSPATVEELNLDCFNAVMNSITTAITSVPPQ